MQQCREVTGLQMTNTEKLIYQLIEGNEPYNSTLWNHPTLMMNPSTITGPLTSLPYASDTEAAVKLNEVGYGNLPFSNQINFCFLGSVALLFYQYDFYCFGVSRRISAEYDTEMSSTALLPE